MQTCKSCDIQIGTSGSLCPVCQNPLSGDFTDNIWPASIKLKKQTILFKLQFFIFCSLVIVCLLLDFLLFKTADIHFSYVVIAGVFAFEIFINQAINTNMYAAKFIFIFTFYTMLFVIFSGWYLGFLGVIIDIVLPIILCIMLLTNTILALSDKNGNSLIYLIVNIFISVIAYIALYIKTGTIPNVAWLICLIVAVVSSLSTIIFLRSQVMSEIEKRMSI